MCLPIQIREISERKNGWRKLVDIDMIKLEYCVAKTFVVATVVCKQG